MQKWVKSLEFEVTLVYKEVPGQAGLYRETSKKGKWNKPGTKQSTP